MLIQHGGNGMRAFRYRYTSPMSRDELIKLTHLVSCAG